MARGAGRARQGGAGGHGGPGEQGAPAAAPLAHLPAADPSQDAQRLEVSGTAGAVRASGGTRAPQLQTITSVSSVMPVVLTTASRILSMSEATSRNVAPPRLMMKLAWISDTTAPPTAIPLRPLRSMRRPACSPGGFLKIQPAFLAPAGWVATRWSW